MNKFILAASAAALITAAGTVPSLAQSSSSSGAGTMTMPSITCRDLSGMDQQTARNVVFFLGGLNASAHGSSAMNATTGSTGSSTTADAGSSGSGSAGSTTGTTDASGTSTTADAGSSGSSTTGTAGTAESGSAATTADAGTAGSGTDATGSTTAAAGSSGTAASGAVMAQLPGFAMINADQIITTCQGQPDMQLSTLLGSGSSAQ